MNLDTELIEAIAANLAAKGLHAPLQNDRPDAALIIEAGRLYKAIDCHLQLLTNETQRDTYLNKMLARLVKVCDALFAINDRVSSDTTVLLELLTKVRELLPARVSPLLKLPDAFVDTQQNVFKMAWEKQAAVLTKLGVDPLLIKIAALPVHRFEKPGIKLYWCDFTWMKRYFSELENTDWENSECNSKTEAFVSLLLRMNFNSQRFYAYVYRLVMKRVDAHPGKKQKLDELYLCKTLILQDGLASGEPFNIHGEPIVGLLERWIEAQKELIRVISDDPGFQNPYKLEHDTDILSLAFWYKLLYDHKFFKVMTIDEFADRISRNCSTPRQAILSAISLKTKFYTKDVKVIKGIEEKLAAMLADVRLYLR